MSISHQLFGSMRIMFLLLLCGLNLCSADERPETWGFESDRYEDWQVEGTAFGPGPARGSLNGQMQVSGFTGERLANSFVGGDDSTGSLTSMPFRIEHAYLAYRIGGGRRTDEIGIELLIDGLRVRADTADESETLVRRAWDVSEFIGREAQLRIFDRAVGGWGHILADDFTQTDEPVHPESISRLEDYRRSAEYYRERFRPGFHFTPEIHWMNDPNGLVFHQGEFHLFYQHNPHGIEWGHMSWGHAVSEDLIAWKHLPIALHEEYGVMAFSGSAVHDEKNTSGFGDEEGPLVAIYTGHGFGKQTQDLAFSRDRGRTWTKYAGNPVLDENASDFRDPKVFWHQSTARWIMVVSMAVEKKIRFYGSRDLKQWELLGQFGPAGVPQKLNWECPDLFELPIEGEPGQTRWVLEVDMGNGAVAGGSGGEYFIGHFDGRNFVPEHEGSQWVDFGRDFYAPISWSNVPENDGRRIWIGWMNNWETCLNPTFPWRSAMSIPRELTLRRIDGQLRLCQQPVRELDRYRVDGEVTNNIEVSGNSKLDQVGARWDLTVEFEPGDAKEFGVRVMEGESEATVIGYDTQRQELFVDRTRSGMVDFHPAFAGRHAAPFEADDRGRIRLRILVDECSVEVFGGEGEVTITDLVFPSQASRGMSLFSKEGNCRVTHWECHRIDAPRPVVESH